MAARITARRFLSSFSQTQRPSLVRTMATSKPLRPYEFVCIIPDKPGPEVRAKRLEVRPPNHDATLLSSQHFSDMTPTLKDGWLKMGGGLLNEVPEDDDANKFDFAGSIMVLLADSKEEVLEKLRGDIYTRAGVWDLEKAQIYPFKLGFRFP
ncbi:dimeric alpha-beta barrel [Trichoderma arundinaceum]|uniref:Dimeric alpha-beta barrel n=1 Tax=Trichoderma arundinaceum TaxID=490622 RepID=A0A395NMK9_TRIAR|nr:dimeric alpha-beta barrel [Trichoderma arundinaceum]